MKVEVSNGEILDKLSILEIKLLKINDGDKIVNILNELEELNPFYIILFEAYGDVIKKLYLKLSKINHRLWEIEDEIRILEKHGSFEKDFVFLARSVYKINDLRTKVKREINDITNSALVEEKSYETT